MAIHMGSFRRTLGRFSFPERFFVNCEETGYDEVNRRASGGGSGTEMGSNIKFEKLRIRTKMLST